jgi:hypothetical protein
MRSFVSIRLATAGFAFSALLPAQLLAAAQTKPTPQTKPNSIAPSASGLPTTPPTTPTPPSTPSQLPPRHAQITYTSGALSISADNSSLNQILNEISHETGIKISGGVPEERVFGTYGPDAPSQVLAALLDGTGSNVLLVPSDGDTPPQLILTQRQGAPTPPNPAAATSDNRTALRGAPAEPIETAPGEPTQNRSPREPSGAPVTSAPPSSDPSQPESPNGVKTPQQIYDQLQRLHQQQPPQPPQ